MYKLTNIDVNTINVFTTMFISILLEAFPFIMLGVIISSLIQLFVSEEFIARVMPKNKVIGIFIGIIMGLFFPVCDCAVIPVCRRLIKKGVPLSTAITFMLSAPIINPVVLVATNYAFGTLMPSMLFYRALIGICAAILIAFIIGTLFENKNVLKPEIQTHHHCHCEGCHDHQPSGGKLSALLNHVGEEFFDVGKYLIIGAFIATAAQVFIPQEMLLAVGQNKAMSIIVLMVFAYAISLCSTSDSFIAKTFISQFTNSSILAFLILGPMLDIKNTIVLFGNFKKSFVFHLIFILFIIVFLSVYCMDLFLIF